jgi:hypothetical protein
MSHFRDDVAAGYALVSASEATYPRRGQPIVPRRLALLLVNGALPAAATDAKLAARMGPADRRKLANRAVRWLRSRLPTLPATIASGHMPPPEAVLKSLLLDTRTRNVLLRGGPEGQRRREAWCVRDYLALPGFGARGLLDVLTSLEASSVDPSAQRSSNRRASASAPDRKLGDVLERIERVQRKHRREDLRPAPPSLAPSRFADGDYLAKTIDLIVPELPLSDHAIRERLQTAGIGAGAVDLVRLAKAASRLSLESPFVVIALGAGKLVLRRRDVPVATSAYSIAVRTTLNWGVATIAGVTSQLSSVAGAVTGPGFVGRVLAAARGFEWLDQDNGWFWFRNRPSRLLDGLQKVFSVVTELSLPRLYWALFKGHDERMRPPAVALPSLASALPGARVERELVVVPRRLDRSTYLSSDERTLVEILESAGGALSPHALRAAASPRSLSSRAILALLRGSPLVEVLPDGRCCLIGASIGGAGRLTSL